MLLPLITGWHAALEESMVILYIMSTVSLQIYCANLLSTHGRDANLWVLSVVSQTFGAAIAFGCGQVQRMCFAERRPEVES